MDKELMENIEIDLAYAIRQLQFALDHVPNENMRLGDKAGLAFITLLATEPERAAA
jgi:hypothetical protein